jgi:hypothetical protein
MLCCIRSFLLLSWGRSSCLWLWAIGQPLLPWQSRASSASWPTWPHGAPMAISGFLRPRCTHLTKMTSASSRCLVVSLEKNRLRPRAANTTSSSPGS